MSPEVPYGAWKSPISAADVARTDGRPRWVGVVGGGDVWWTEPRPHQGGRVALVRSPAQGGGGAPELPAPWNVRNRVVEYGGRPWHPTGSDASAGILFTHWDDQRLYRWQPAEPRRPPEPVSPAPPTPHGLRYADLVPGPSGDEAWGVRETVTGPAPTDVRRDLVAVPIDGTAADHPEAVRVLAASHHFLTGPRIAPDGHHVAWIGWDHPRMPWDGTELCVAPVGADGAVGPHRVLAGGPTEAVVQLAWADAQSLYAVTDPDGWWNIHRIPLDGSGPRNVCPRAEEFGGALWKPGQSWFATLGDGRLATIHGTHRAELALLDPATGTLTAVDTPFTEWDPGLVAVGTTVVGVAASPSRPWTVVRVDTATGDWETLGTPPGPPPDPTYLPVPEPRTFVGPGGREVHANLYPPRHPDAGAPDGEAPNGDLPPYVVWAHGGPTGRSPMVYDPEIAYFTSRGIGVVDVNYGGSTGYGRAYRERLREQWGVVDVDDCAAAARGLAEAGLADPQRLAIRGGSAGGWTTVASAATVDLYHGAVAYYPILDLAAWRADTHDFESRYLDGLVGPWPDTWQRHRDRSPTAHVDRIGCPVLLLQGLEDVICPPSQCEAILGALRDRGVPHAYLTFHGEQHGFRRADTIARGLEAELSFYGQVLGFEPPDVPPLELVR